MVKCCHHQSRNLNVALKGQAISIRKDQGMADLNREIEPVASISTSPSRNLAFFAGVKIADKPWNGALQRAEKIPLLCQNLYICAQTFQP